MLVAVIRDSRDVDLILGTNALRAIKFTVTWDEQMPSIPGHPIVRGLPSLEEEKYRRFFKTPKAIVRFDHCE